MEEKKVIKVRLITAVLLILLFIMLIAYIIFINIEKNKADNENNLNMNYINTTEQTGSNIPAEDVQKDHSEDINVVASMNDEITTNSVWCGTFQLVWNDMVNNVIKRDVKFLDGDNLEVAQKMADNLDKQTFKEDQLSEKDYYKIFDTMSLKLKEKIEKDIIEKFNENSDILDDIEWYDDPKVFVFYTMLKKVFNFKNDFDELENDMFANKYENIKYFGISKDSDSKLYSQVDVLYYTNTDNFAVVLNTKEGEQVILARGVEGNTFALMYNDIVKKTNDYNGNKKFTENDLLKVPNIKLNTKKEYKEFYDKKFLDKENFDWKIKKSIQTIQLEMDKSGGKLKSEAIIVTAKETVVAEKHVEKRYFNLTDEFTMFLKEKDKELPYFAANIEDITLFQD